MKRTFFQSEWPLIMNETLAGDVFVNLETIARYIEELLANVIAGIEDTIKMLP